MKVFERDDTGRATVFRFVLWMDTKNDWLRRLWITVTIPFLLAYNTAIAVVLALLAVIVWWVDNNKELFRMAVVRWNAQRVVE